jgi:hypothetical protein
MNLCKLSLGLCAVALLAGCGTPGDPISPSLELARPVTDLRATRKGDKIVLTWSAPSLTTDRHNITHPGEIELCGSLGSPVRECGQPVAKLPTPGSPAKNSGAKPQITYADHLPARLQFENPTANIYYAVAVLNSYGRTAGLSNQVQIPAAPALPPPANFQTHLSADGVRLSWEPVEAPAVSGVRFAYRVYRREKGTNRDVIAGEVPVATGASWLDQGFEWEKTYEYHASVVTLVAQTSGEQQVEGEDTTSVTVIAHDIFAPATPSGLQAVFSGPGQKPFIDLVWAPNTETDLAGYNIYRGAGSQPLKVNSELVKASAYRDSGIAAGSQYSYSVSAVDVRGNESARSEEATESVPSE